MPDALDDLLRPTYEQCGREDLEVMDDIERILSTYSEDELYDAYIVGLVTALFDPSTVNSVYLDFARKEMGRRGKARAELN